MLSWNTLIPQLHLFSNEFSIRRNVSISIIFLFSISSIIFHFFFLLKIFHFFIWFIYLQVTFLFTFFFIYFNFSLCNSFFMVRISYLYFVLTFLLVMKILEHILELSIFFILEYLLLRFDIHIHIILTAMTM